ncbi:MAG: alanine racemase [Campylobacterota bacterium]
MGYITLSREALIHNLDIIAQQVGAKDKIAVVLKDNAYGHGAVAVAEAAAAYGVNDAVVRTEAEALEIEPFFERILILADTATRLNPKFSYALNSLEEIAHFLPGTRVELKIDTGMHRNGIAPSQLAEAFEKMALGKLECVGVMSHLRSAETLSSEWFWQRRTFDSLKETARTLAASYGWSPRFHLSNSAGTFRSSECTDDMARVGIALYGCLEMDKGLETPPLKPVLSLWGKRIATRVLKKGERIGYNGIYEAATDEVVSTYDLGYANGLDRLASNRYTTPQGIALRGRISMDNAVFASDAEELLVFDNANGYARSVGTIGYEILACLDKSLERRWTK